MAFIYTIASGSSGNCILVSDGETNILVDAGVSMRRISLGLKNSGMTLADISAIYITHEHTDHICGLSMIAKQYTIPVFASYPTARCLSEQIPAAGKVLNVLRPGETVFTGDMEIFPFKTPHDTPESLGFKIRAGGKNIVLVTDLGYVPSGILSVIKRADFLYIESNHDITALSMSRYPAFLKKRILSERGHLSNIACAEAVAEAVASGTQYVLLAHLSKENNTPSLAYDTTKNRLAELGINVSLSVAPGDVPGEICYI